VPGPGWSDDDPADRERIAANAAKALQAAQTMAMARALPTEDDMRAWHATIYAGCTVPSVFYVGHFRGDAAHPDLTDYEVGIGPDMPDGLPERVGVWAADVAAEVADFFARLHQAFIALDAAVPAGERPTTVDALHEVVALAAIAHGEWVRIPPFVNGNGRTGRLLAAHVALRYGLPVFVTLKPRPHDVAYVRAAKRSMGRPPHFIGDHTEAVAVFTHMLNLTLLGP
jgi:hypothetical protein